MVFSLSSVLNSEIGWIGIGAWIANAELVVDVSDVPLRGSPPIDVFFTIGIYQSRFSCVSLDPKFVEFNFRLGLREVKAG